jgi:hypothetical protein
VSYTEKDFLDLSGLTRYDALIKEYIPLTHGYYSNGNFYKESSLTTLITGEVKRLYIDLNSNGMYEYTGSAYIKIGGYTNGINAVVSTTQPVDQVAGDIWFIES